MAGASGGVGRTTMALSIGATLAQTGADVLMVDLDPRASLTHLLGFLDEERRRGGILEALAPESEPYNFVLETGYPGLSLLASDAMDVSGHVQLEAALADRRALPRMLAPLLEYHHVIVIDVPTGAGRIPRAAFSASDEVLVPVLPEPLAVRALPGLLDALVDARQVDRSRPRLAGIFLNQVQPDKPFFRQIVATLFSRFDPLMLQTGIPADPWFIEAAARAMPLPFLLPESAGAGAVVRLIDELMHRLRSAASGG